MPSCSIIFTFGKLSYKAFIPQSANGPIVSHIGKVTSLIFVPIVPWWDYDKRYTVL